MNKIEPRTLKGFRDIFSDEIIAREKVVSTIKRVYESYGFSPLATPALEYNDILVGYGEEANKQIYTFRDPDEISVGLRYDLTSPLSRVIAQYKNLEMPFRRYQIQEVFRYDKPDKGRFREFLQFDIDTVGISSVIADAEIIAAMYQSIKALGVSRFKIRINNRKILEELIRFAGIEPSLSYSVFRVIDKLDKQGLDAVLAELGEGRVDASGAEIRGLFLKKEQIDKIKEFIMLPQATQKEALDSVTSLLGDCEGIEELREIDRYLEGVGIDDDKVVIDFVVARGLDYYTGPVYEAILLDAAGYGSIMGGGRYDRLIGQFMDKDIPATGASIGVDRLVLAMQKLGLVKRRKNNIDVLITCMVRDKLVEYHK
ncbi:MAG: histidine--tRNA ligase, partial [bacterium (Candidatus Stahlbacteria) CG08_land_8_20_14_0_20_40_26]